MERVKIRHKHFWLLTLMDLMLLMLTLFIMLYTMSSQKGKENTIYQPSVSTPFSALRRSVHLNYLEQILTQQMALFDGYRIKKERNSLLIKLPSFIFSQKEQKKLSILDEIRLKQLGENLANISNEILLQVSSKKTNIQDALSQALIVANKLKEGGYSENLRIIYQDNPTNDFMQIIIFEQIRTQS